MAYHADDCYCSSCGRNDCRDSCAGAVEKRRLWIEKYSGPDAALRFVAEQKNKGLSAAQHEVSLLESELADAKRRLAELESE